MCPPNPLPPADAVRTVRKPDGTFTYLTESSINLQTASLGSAVDLLTAIRAKDFATQTTLAALDAKIPASPAQEHVTAASPHAARLSDGAAFYKATTPADTQPVSLVAVPLPSGASTSANQTTEIGHLASLVAKDFATQTTLAAALAQLVANNFNDFGTASNLGQNVNDAFTFDNTGGYSSIQFRVVPPTGGTMVFEGSADGDNWDSTTMRSTVQDEYIVGGTTTDIVIGSISALRKFRVRTTVAGSAAGTVKGRAQRDASTVEGAEFDQRPDKIGASLITRSAQFSTAQTGTAIWTPASGKRFFVVSYKINASGATDATITIFDETDTATNWISPPGFYDVSVNNSIIDNETFSIPYKSAAVGNHVRVTSTAGINFSVTVRGYEAP